MLKYSEFEIQKIFDKIETNKAAVAQATDSNVVPATTAGWANNQLTKFAFRPGATVLTNKISVTANGLGKAFFQPRPFTVLQDSYAIDLKDSRYRSNREILIYLVGALNKVLKKYDYNNKSGWNRIKIDKIYLPITADGSIDFFYMEKRIRELEVARIRELEAYLKVTGLSNYSITDADRAILSKYREGGGRTKLFRISDLFEWQNVHEINPQHILRLKVEGGAKYPFYGQSTSNNGIIDHYSLSARVLNNEKGLPAIMIHSNNQNIIYLETPFYLKDGHGASSVIQSKNLNRYVALYMITAIGQVIKNKYSYASKATKIALKHTRITLPCDSDDRPDYGFMEFFIRVQQKLAIKNVAEWRDMQANAVKLVVSQ
ncbi:MAG: restriction endonuclease subunit S [Candidatus Nomurabacteria bacterium]|jgi:hypothetical protein|nr:restriction endonuclease subunit S [Candidatus Nomurabacteria bacterium]